MVRYVLVLPIDAHDSTYVGQLPLHCTLIPPFETDIPLRDIVKCLTEIGIRYRPVRLVSDLKENWGARSQIEVHVLARNSRLTRLHYEILHALRGLGIEIVSKFVGDSYRPHVTSRGEERFEPGRMHEVSAMALLDYHRSRVAPEVPGLQKSMVAEVPFGA